jgi:GNAT superfamily N-acetyltransferase
LAQNLAMPRLTFRFADATDAVAVAELHADSWRRHYRGAYADEFLDGDVHADRLSVWTSRLDEPDNGLRATVLAEVEGQAIGFVHTVLDADAQWGGLIDNLHVTARLQGCGIGAALMARAAGFVSDNRPDSGLYLWVLEQNRAAQGFYQALGGTPADSEPVRPVNGVPGRLQGSPIGIRYVWADPSILAARPIHCAV